MENPPFSLYIYKENMGIFMGKLAVSFREGSYKGWFDSRHFFPTFLGHR